MYRIVRLAAIAALLGLTLFAVGCGSKSDDTGSTTTGAATSTPAAKSDATTTPGVGGKAEGGTAQGQGEILPPPPNAVKK